MLSMWTQHIKDQEEKKQYSESLLHTRWVLERQNQLLLDMETSLEKQEESPSAFDNPNWQYKQAYAIGYRAALHKIKRLNNLDQKENSNGRQPIRKD